MYVEASIKFAASLNKKSLVLIASQLSDLKKTVVDDAIKNITCEAIDKIIKHSIDKISEFNIE